MINEQQPETRDTEAGDGRLCNIQLPPSRVGCCSLTRLYVSLSSIVCFMASGLCLGIIAENNETEHLPELLFASGGFAFYGICFLTVLGYDSYEGGYNSSHE